MQSAGPRENEARHLAALHALDVLDSGPEAEFDALARSASLVCGVPISLISLIDTDRQWFKANLGLPGVVETPRELAFCAHAVLGSELFEIADASLDPRFAGNPLVVGDPNIRFYAGVPLRLSDGACVGTLCVIDRQPRELSELQREVLRNLALAAAHALEGRRASLMLRVATRDNEERLRRQYEATPAMLHSIDAQGRLVAVSDMWLTKLGYRREEVLGRKSTDFLSPASQEFARTVVLPEFFASGRCDGVEYQMLTHDGEVLDVLLSATLERDEQGEALRSLAITEDVTLRRRAERALQEEKQRLDDIIDGTDVGTWEWNLHTGELRCNPRFAAMVGQRIEAESPTLAHALTADAHPDDLDLCSRLLKQHLEQRSLRYECELRLRHRDGHWIWVQDRGRVTQWTADGQPEWMFGTRRDISERKHNEVALIRSQEFLDRTGKLAGVGGWELDVASGEVTWSDETRRIHGVGPDYRPVLAEAIDFYAPESRPVIQAAVERGLAEGQPWDLELRLIRADGRPIWVRAVGAVDFVDGKPTRLAGAFQDITERSAAERALRELTAIFDNTTDFVVLTDRNGGITYMNPSARRAIGMAPDAPVAHLDYPRFNTPTTNRLYAEAIMPALLAGAPAWLGEATVHLADQRETPVSLMVLAHRDGAGRIERFSAVMRDISADVVAQREVLRQTATLTSVTEAIPATVAVVGLDGTYRFVNGAFERWWGLPRDRILGGRVKDVLGEQEFNRRLPWVERAFSGEAVNFVLDYPSRDGATYLALSYVPLRLDSGEVDGFVVVTQDITHQKQEELRLLQLSRRDPLTGLLNRAGFEQHLERAVAEGASLALLYVDLDDFKPVNDHHGHAAGDQILQAFARRLTNLVRPTDAVARLGGDEFAIALTGTGERFNAQAVGDKVLAAACAPFNVGALRIQIGASIGIAFDADRDSGWQELVERADVQLLAAKVAGKGRQVGAVQ